MGVATVYSMGDVLPGPITKHLPLRGWVVKLYGDRGIKYREQGAF